MLGGFSLGWGETVLELGARSRKLYLLLAYLIRARERDVPYPELARLLWPGQEPDNSTWGALKALLHRARSFLGRLGADMGKLLLNRDGLCRWDPAVPLSVDAEEFAALCRGEGGGAPRLEGQLRALALYRGDFLPAADCPWAAEQARELHGLWRRAALEALPLLAEEGQWEQAAGLAEKAMGLEPWEEAFCRSRMEALLRLDRRREAVQVYEGFQTQLLAQKGVLPSDGLRQLCRAARDDPDERVFTAANLPDRLREPAAAGALLCGFDFFQVLCFSFARLARRGKQPLYAALFTLSGAEGLPRHSLDRAMDNLQGVILGSLRRGDAVCRCSTSQFVLLLPGAGYEAAQQASRRVCRAFSRQFPHAPVRLELAVLPLTQA